MRNSTLRLRSLQNITQGLNTSRMATDLVPLEANLGDQNDAIEAWWRLMVSIPHILATFQPHTRKLQHDP